MELELKRPEKLKIKLDGQVYELARVKFAESLSIEKRIKENGPQELLAFLVEHGLPLEVAEGLEIELVERIVEELQPKKKS